MSLLQMLTTASYLSAGITAIIKTSKIMSMLSVDFCKLLPSSCCTHRFLGDGRSDPPPTDDGVDLFLWGNLESTITIIAASIPILRVLIRDVKTSAVRYYASGDDSMAMRSKGGQHTTNTTLSTTAVVISSGPPRISLGVQTDEGSDKSILGDLSSMTMPTSADGKILQTTDIAVEYHDRNGAKSSEFEMDRVDV